MSTTEEHSSQEYPVRAGVFETLEVTKKVVDELHQAGFKNDQLSIICSDETQRQHFAEAEVLEPSGSHTNRFLNRAGAVALGAGGVTVAALTLLTAGTTAVVGIGVVSGLAITGTLAAVFGTRGFENEASDFYDQAVQAGKLLVAVEAAESGEEGTHELQSAEEVFRRNGSEPIPLSH